MVNSADATLQPDILVDVLLQWLIVVVNITFVFYYVAVGSIVGRVYRDNVALETSVLDLLRLELAANMPTSKRMVSGPP